MKKICLWWRCKRCGKLIPYMEDFCHECADKLLGEAPKPFEPQAESENKESYNDGCWCDTCKYNEYEYLGSECFSCAKYDENYNLITLSNYKKESEG